MLAHDVYQRAYDAATSDLEAWAATQRDVATVDVEHGADFWRLRVVPHAVNACPVELIVHRRQRADLTIGPETYEDRPIGDFAVYRKLLDAIAAGHVVVERWESAATGVIEKVETIVRLGDGGTWRDRRDVADVRDALKVSQHFVKYRR